MWQGSGAHLGGAADACSCGHFAGPCHMCPPRCVLSTPGLLPQECREVARAQREAPAIESCDRESAMLDASLRDHQLKSSQQAARTQEAPPAEGPGGPQQSRRPWEGT